MPSPGRVSSRGAGLSWSMMRYASASLHWSAMRTTICPIVARASVYAPPSVCEPRMTCTPNARPCRTMRSSSTAAPCEMRSSSVKNSWNSSIISNARGIGCPVVRR